MKQDHQEITYVDGKFQIYNPNGRRWNPDASDELAQERQQEPRKRPVANGSWT